MNETRQIDAYTGFPLNVSAWSSLDRSLHDRHHQGPGLPVNYQAGLIALYSVTTLLAVTGNLVVIVVLAVGRRSRTDLRCFLLNLAVADLMMALFCLPFTFTTTMLHDWVFGAGMCTIVLFVQVVTVTASVGTSTAIAVNRCIVVLNPLRPRDDSRTRLTIVCVIWLVAGVLSAVQLVVARTITVEAAPGAAVNLTVCAEAWPQDAADAWRTGYTFFVLLTTYVIPLAAIGPAYALVARRLWKRQTPGSSVRARDLLRLESKRRVIKMLTVMVTLFAVCWLPLHVFTVVVDFVPPLRNEDHAEADGIVVAVYTAVHWLAMSSCFVNPIVYGFLNDNFRSDLRWLTISCCKLGSRNRDTILDSKQIQQCRRRPVDMQQVQQLVEPTTTTTKRQTAPLRATTNGSNNTQNVQPADYNQPTRVYTTCPPQLRQSHI